MKKMNKKWMALSLTAVFSLSLLTACSTPSAQSTQDTPQGVGTLLLSVNPEIQISYDDEGNVVALTGQNEDGKQVVSAFQEAKGQPCEKVVPALVERIHEDGYFDDTIDGNEKNIILKLERGSEYPSDDFLNQLAVAVQAVVDDDRIGSQTMTLDDDDYDPAYAQQGYISAKAAQEAGQQRVRRPLPYLQSVLEELHSCHAEDDEHAYAQLQNMLGHVLQYLHACESSGHGAQGHPQHGLLPAVLHVLQGHGTGQTKGCQTRNHGDSLDRKDQNHEGHGNYRCSKSTQSANKGAQKPCQHRYEKFCFHVPTRVHSNVLLTK